MRKILQHCLLGMALGFFVFLLSYLAMLIPGMGYGVFVFVFALTLFAQGVFYGLTAIHGRAWSTLGFVVNLILWVTELVQLEHQLDGSSIHRLLYHNDNYYALRFMLGGILWATNKLAIDAITGWIIERRAASPSHG